MQNDTRVTADLVRSIYTFDPEEGIFRYRETRSGKCKAGSVAGSRKPNGYVLMSINGLFFQAGRVAWLYMHGEWPTHTIDHINRDRSDNRIANLRDVTNQVNSRNLGHQRANNTSGFVGVYFFKRSKRYHAQISHEGKLIFLGGYVDIQDAAKAYAEAKQKYHAIPG